MEITLDEAFKDLISRRKWYANTSGSFQQDWIKSENTIREVMIGLGFQEIMSFNAY